MDNPPPFRPMFRLASQIRVEPPSQPRPAPTTMRPPVGRPYRPLMTVPPQFRPQPPPPQPQTQPQQPLPPPPQPQRQEQPQPQPQPQQQPQPTQMTQPQPTLRTPTVVRLPSPQPIPVRAPSVTTSPIQSKAVSLPSSQPQPQPTPRPPTFNVPETQPQTQMRSFTPSVPTSPAQFKMQPSPTPKTSYPSMPTLPIQNLSVSQVATQSKSPPPTIKPTSTPPQSPKTKSSAPPPSPLTLPPSQFRPVVPEPESKSVVVAEQKILAPDSKEKKNGESRPSSTEKKGKESPKKKKDEHELRVITIAGDNKGAYMELFHSKKGNPHDPHKTSLEVKSNNEYESDSKSGNSCSSSRNSGDSKSKKKENNGNCTKPMKSFVNSNVQAVNNSIVFNSSCSHSDPGVHLLISRKPNGGQVIHHKDQTNGHHSLKDD